MNNKKLYFIGSKDLGRYGMMFFISLGGEAKEELFGVNDNYYYCLSGDKITCIDKDDDLLNSILKEYEELNLELIKQEIVKAVNNFLTKPINDKLANNKKETVKGYWFKGSDEFGEKFKSFLHYKGYYTTGMSGTLSSHFYYTINNSLKYSVEKKVTEGLTELKLSDIECNKKYTSVPLPCLSSLQSILDEYSNKEYKYINSVNYGNSCYLVFEKINK